MSVNSVKERFSDFEQYLYDELIDEIDLVSRTSSVRKAF